MRRDDPGAESARVDEELRNAGESDAAAVDRLARLPLFDYERIRKAEAERLGFERVAILDTEVARRRRELFPDQASDEQGTEFSLDDPLPWGVVVDGAALILELAADVRRYVVLPEDAAFALALWVLHTYAIDLADCAPILAIVSPEKRCGKTALISWLARLCSRALPASNISSSAVFRAVEKWKPTLLIDEAETFLSENEPLRGVLNSGHTRGAAYVIRSVGDDNEPRRFNTFGAKALAQIGMPPATILDRSIIVRMRRRMRGEQIEKFSGNGQAETVERLRRQCVRFISDHVDLIQCVRPEAPSVLNDREGDNWSNPFAIAECAGAEILVRARAVAVILALPDDDASGAGVELLRDIASAFERKTDSGAPADERRLLSADLLGALSEDTESRWATLNHGKLMTDRQLAQRLRPFDIKSRDMRTAGGRGKGYSLAQFSDALARYVRTARPPEMPRQRDNGINLLNEKAESVTDVPVTKTAVTDVSATPPNVMDASVTRKPAPGVAFNDLSRCHGIPGGSVARELTARALAALAPHADRGSAAFSAAYAALPDAQRAAVYDSPELDRLADRAHEADDVIDPP